jgi:hypothetical protein
VFAEVESWSGHLANIVEFAKIFSPEAASNSADESWLNRTPIDNDSEEHPEEKTIGTLRQPDSTTIAVLGRTAQRSSAKCDCPKLSSEFSKGSLRPQSEEFQRAAISTERPFSQSEEFQRVGRVGESQTIGARNIQTRQMQTTIVIQVR